MSLDEQFIHQRSNRYIYNTPQSFYGGFKEGVKELTAEWIEGITGVVKTPLKHAKNGEGLKGVVKGIGIGLAG